MRTSCATATLNSTPSSSSPPLFFYCATCQKCDVSKHKVLVASVCPQSLPFFAVKFGVDITDAAHKLCGFLKSIGEQVGVTSSGGFYRLKIIKWPHVMQKNHFCFFFLFVLFSERFS